MGDFCYPWWHPIYAPLAAQGWGRRIVPSGCGSADPATGDVPCTPEKMRAASEAWLAQNAPAALARMGGHLSLDAYTYARYIHSEVGTGTPEEMVAVGEAGRNQARVSKRSIYDLLIPTGRYGPIHGPESVCLARGYVRGSRQNRCTDTTNPATCCAPHGRWAATARDPSVLAILLGHLVASGQSGDFANGADDQWGPDSMARQIDSADAARRFVTQIAQGGAYWAGPLPGVYPWTTFLVRPRPGVTPASVEGATRIQQAVEALWPRRSPPTRLPVCSRAGSSAASPAQFALGVLAVGGLLGLYIMGRKWAARRAMLHGHRPR
jgi:hypothetical protein